MEIVKTIVALIAALTFVFPLFLPLLMFGMSVGWSSVRLETSDSQVHLVARDAMALLGVVVLGGLASWCAFKVCGVSQGFAGVLLTIVVASSCRVTFEVGAEHAELRHSVFWLVPWRWVSVSNPAAWEEGWGDFDDPSAFWIGGESYSIEVGWWTQGAATIGPTAEEFNAAVARVRGRSPRT